MVSLTELINKHHHRIKNGSPSELYHNINDNYLCINLTPNDFIEAQKMLLGIIPRDITEINFGIVAAYLNKQEDLEEAYKKVKEVLREVIVSPYLPKESKISIEVIVR